MQKVRYLSLTVLLILLLYLAVTALFAWLFRIRNEAVHITRTPAPTFTLAPPTAVVVIPTATPSPTPTPVPPTPTSTPTPGPQLTAASTVNIRSGPGTNYPVITALPPNLVVPITGRNNEASWWQISNAGGTTGWVANAVVQASNTANVPVVVAPPPPPTPTPAATPTPEKPKYQFEPTGWYHRCRRQPGQRGLRSGQLRRFLRHLQPIRPRWWVEQRRGQLAARFLRYHPGHQANPLQMGSEHCDHRRPAHRHGRPVGAD
jgi:hypothetical protein